MPKKFNEIILHIGLNKTGSSSLQQAFKQYKEEFLSQSNLYFPLSLGKNQSIWLLAHFEDADRPNILNPSHKKTNPESQKIVEELYQNFEQELREAEGERLLISGEMISILGEEGIVKWKERLDLFTDHYRIVFVVRHPVTWTRSVIQQGVKEGKKLSNLYDKVPRQHLETRIRRWQKYFPKDALSLIDYEEISQNKTDIVHAFCDVCRINYSFYPVPDPGINMSMSQDAVEKINAMNEASGKNLKGEWIEDVMKKREHLFELPGEKFTIPESVQQKAWKQAKEDMAWLTENFQIEYQFNPFSKG